MKKIEWLVVIIAIILAGWVGWKIQNVKSPPTEEKLQTTENSLSMSTSFIHQTDNFYNIQVEYPQFSNIDSAFNKKISDLVTGEIETFKKDAKDNYEARRATATPPESLPENPEIPFDFIGTWEPTQLNDTYISFVIRLYYFVGGAHGVNEVHAFNYDLKKAKEITILDFLNSSQPALEKLANLSSQDITSQMQSSGLTIDSFLQQMIESGTKPTLENYQNFNFNYNSLIIYFQQYQVAPGAAGPITVTFYKSILDTNSINSDYLR
jgi:hypothetical protein